MRSAASWLKEPNSPWIAIRIDDEMTPFLSRTATFAAGNATYYKCNDVADGRANMLWTIFVVLLVLWLVGLASFHAIGAYIHILLVIALVVLLIQLIGGRRTVV